MAPYTTVMRLRQRLLETANDEATKSREDGAPQADTVAEHIREFVWQRDRFAANYRETLRHLPEMNKEDLEEVVEAALRVCRSALALSQTLRGHVERLGAAGQVAPGADDLERAVADFERWLEDVPDEMLLHYRPVTEAIEQVAVEALRNRPTASDWRSLFDDEAGSQP